MAGCFALPHLLTGNHPSCVQESNNKTSISAPRVGQVEVFFCLLVLCSCFFFFFLGDLGDPKGFESPIGGNTGLQPGGEGFSHQRKPLVNTGKQN